MTPNTDFCLLCGGILSLMLDGVRDDQWGVPGVFAIHRCHTCGVELTLPRLTDEDLRRLYERPDPLAAAGRTPETAARRARLQDRLMGSWLYRLWLRIDGDIGFHLARGNGRLLDLGCNEGRGLERYRGNGFAAEGWELNRKAAERARARGFTVHTGPLAELRPAAPYDVIVLANTFGLSRDPRATLRELRRLLAEDGELWISLPNSASLFREMFGRHWINWHVPFRAVHFSPRVLRWLLADEGFEVRAFSCVTPTLWLTRSCLVTLYGYPGAPTERLHTPWLVAGWMLVLRLFFFPTLFFLNRAIRGDGLILRVRKAAL